MKKLNNAYEELVTRVFEERVTPLLQNHYIPDSKLVFVETCTSCICYTQEHFGYDNTVEYEIHVNLKNLIKFCSIVKHITASDSAVCDSIYLLLCRECFRIDKRDFNNEYEQVEFRFEEEWINVRVNDLVLTKDNKGKLLNKFFLEYQQVIANKKEGNIDNLKDFRNLRIELSKLYNPLYSCFYKALF